MLSKTATRGLNARIVVCGHYATGNVNFYPVRSIFDLFAHGFAHGLRTTDNFSKRDGIDVRRDIVQVRVAAGGGQGVRRHKHARTGEIAARNGVANLHQRKIFIKIAGIAKRGESFGQFLLRTLQSV